MKLTEKHSFFSWKFRNIYITSRLSHDKAKPTVHVYRMMTEQQLKYFNHSLHRVVVPT